MAPIVRNDYLAKLSDKDAFKKILNDVSAQIDTADPGPACTSRSSVDHMDLDVVAKTWLQAKGFVQ